MGQRRLGWRHGHEPTGRDHCHQQAWPPYSETEPQQPPTGTCHASFPVGTTVTFTATADPGSYINYGPDPASLTVRAGYNAIQVMFCPENGLCSSW